MTIETDFIKTLSCGETSDFTNILLIGLGISYMTSFQGLIAKTKANTPAGIAIMGIGGIGLLGKYILKLCDSTQ